MNPNRTPAYEVAVVGGGPAGLTVAMYATRLGHRTALLDQQGGRHAAVNHIHNVIGVSEETSGLEMERLAVDQLVEYGTDYYGDAVSGVEPIEGKTEFRVEANHATLRAERVVLATGFSDLPPNVEGLRRFTGRGLHYCLHCDAYALGDERVFVLGHDDEAAHIAMILLNFTPNVDLVLNGERPTWHDDTAVQVEAHPLDVVQQEAERAFSAEGVDADADEEENLWLGGLEFADGTVREYTGGFAIYGREYNNRLAEELGCDLNDDGSVAVDGRRRTSVDGVYAVGDLTHGQNQTPIAMGDGAYAGLSLHKELRTYPVPAEEIRGEDGDGEGTAMTDLPVPAVDDELRARMRRIAEIGADAGMSPANE